MGEPRKIRAIVADDEIHIRALVKTILKGMNCDIVAEACNGQEAADFYRREKPDILLLDVNMPYKRGDDALIEILKEFPGAFVIMLTSVSDIETIQKCIEAGAANYIRKDTPVAEFKLMLKETWVEFKKNSKSNDHE